MKVIVFGASGIIGQHMRLCIPEGVQAVFVRRQADPLHLGLDLLDRRARREFLRAQHPDVIINLAGESRPDVVERDPDQYRDLNTAVPGELARWCDENGRHLIHVSTQAVFLGDNPPYGPDSVIGGINMYGRQKAAAEHRVRQARNWTIVRPTFVLGVRPLPFIGRENPVEQMCAGGPQKQVGDRWFSISFAREVAADLWNACQSPSPGRTMHAGIPGRISRFGLAEIVAEGVERVSHDDFPGLAPRPMDTSFSGGHPVDATGRELTLTGLYRCRDDFQDRATASRFARAREIAMFLGDREDVCYAYLNQGFGALHNAVAADFRKNGQPRNDWELLNWYRRTDAYIWELSAYHADPGFNYSGMCRGIGERLKADGSQRVLCLGDGIGDLTLSLIRSGIDAHYHDLAGSRTAEFAQFRAWVQLGKYMPAVLTNDWAPAIGVGEWDAVVSLDFLEHVTDVPAWVTAIRQAVKPGGLFCAQNAFNCGSGPQGSIPMHLERNVRFEKDWDPMLIDLGFEQIEASNWYRAPAEVQIAA